MKIKVAIAALFVVVTSSAHAVNYGDPNLSNRADEISRAALECARFSDLPQHFDACLVDKGVTDSTERADALSRAKANFRAAGPAMPSAYAEKLIAPAEASDENAKSAPRSPKAKR